MCIVGIRIRRWHFPLVDKNTLMKLMDGHPFIHEDEIVLLSTMARKSAGPIVEIGSAFGASAILFLLHSSTGTKVHSIDPFIVDSMGTFQADEAKCRKNVLRVLGIFSKGKKYTDWTLHKDYSFNMAKIWNEVEKKPIDLLFIDGDHTYDAVKKDFEDWLPFVKKGGHILFHDSRKEKDTPHNTFNRGWQGSTQFADTLRASDKVALVNEVFSITVWQKK